MFRMLPCCRTVLYILKLHFSTTFFELFLFLIELEKQKQKKNRKIFNHAANEDSNQEQKLNSKSVFLNKHQRNYDNFFFFFLIVTKNHFCHDFEFNLYSWPESSSSCWQSKALEKIKKTVLKWNVIKNVLIRNCFSFVPIHFLWNIVCTFMNVIHFGWIFFCFYCKKIHIYIFHNLLAMQSKCLFSFLF